MKHTVQLNIGLNNNPWTAEQVIHLLAGLDEESIIEEDLIRLRLMAYYVKDKTFNGEVEPTVCAMLERVDMSQHRLVHLVEHLCIICRQESIAVSTETMNLLVFHPSYEGDGYLFDKNLFEYIKLPNIAE